MATFDRTLVLVRERSFLDQLDLALVVIRRRPVTLALALATGVLPFVLINGFLLGQAQAADDEFPLSVLLLWLVAIEAPLATAPLTVVLGGLMFGDRPPAAQVLKALVRGLPYLILFQGILRTIMLLLFFLTPFLPARMPFLNEVILLESPRPPAKGRWPLAIMTRCLDLTRDRGGDLFVRWIIALFFGSMFVLAFAAGTSILERMLFRDTSWELPDEILLAEWNAQLGIWITVGFFGVVRFLGYIDQRIRLEGWEIELRFRTLGAAMEGDES